MLPTNQNVGIFATKSTDISEARKYLIVIGGPTASGKTNISLEVAQHLKCPIISADSRQIYREMKIGTARLLPKDWKGIDHHLLGSISIEEPYSVGAFEKDVLKILSEIYINSDFAVLVGGTGLYIKAVIEGIDEFPKVNPDIRQNYVKLFEENGIETLQKLLTEKDPIYARNVDLNNPHRLIRALSVIQSSGRLFSEFHTSSKSTRTFKVIPIALHMDRQELYDRINHRVDEMMDSGLLDEVTRLAPLRSHPALNTVGYKELFEYLDGKRTLESAIEKIKQHSRNYAKRQITWFKNQGAFVHFSPKESSKIIAYIDEEIGR